MRQDYQCRVCGAQQAARSLEVREMMFGTRSKFSYTECATCLSLQIDGIPENLGQYYPPDYYSFDGGVERLSFRDRLRILAHRLQRFARDNRLGFLSDPLDRRLGPLAEPGLGDLQCRANDRILDVGCGSGLLLRQLRVAGYTRLLGVDPFVDANREFAFGVRVKKCELSSLQGSFDLIMLHHVFEHVVNPADTLRASARLLAPNGRILLRFPSVPCYAFDHYGVDWVQLDAPRHLHIYSRAGLETLAAELGLKLVQWSQDSTALQFWGSEQYQRDIPLFSAQSFAKDRSVLPIAELREMELRAAALNASDRGDQSVAVLAHR